MAGNGIKFSLTGDSSGLDSALAKIGKSAQASAAAMGASYKNQLAGIQSALAKLPQGSLMAPRLRSQESALMRMMGLDKVDTAAIAASATRAANAANDAVAAADLEAAKRNIRARELWRQRAEARANAPLQGPDLTGSGRVQAWREQIAAMRGGAMAGFTTGGMSPGAGGGSRRGNFAVAGSMFTSVARDSAASLASGAPITQVIAQQAPQVLQALAMMRLGTVAWAAVLAGGALVAWHGITKSISEAIFQSNKFAGVNDYLKTRSDSISALRRTMLAESDAERKAEINSIENKEKIASLDEKLNDLQVEKNKLLAEQKYIQGRQAGSGEKEEANTLNQLKIDKAALEEKLKNAQSSPVSSAMRKLELERDMERDALAADAAESAAIMADPSRFAAEKGRKWQLDLDMASRSGGIAQIEDDIAAARTTSEKERAVEIKTLENQIAQVDNQMQRMALYDIAKRAMAGGQALGMTENQRLGAFGGGPTFTLIDINKQQLTTLKSIERAVSGKGGTRGVNFGK